MSKHSSSRKRNESTTALATKKQQQQPKGVVKGAAVSPINQRTFSYARYMAIIAFVLLCIGSFKFASPPGLSNPAKSNDVHQVVAFHDKALSHPLIQHVDCGDYEPAVPGCTPTTCGRVVIDNLFDPAIINSLIATIEKGMVFGGGTGGPSILDLHSGAVSHGEKFINIYQMAKAHEREVFNSTDLESFLYVKNKVKAMIESHFDVNQLYLTSPTFFSRINSNSAKTANDMYWMPHIDRLTYGSFVYTSLVYLNDQGDDYEGGEFVFVERDDVQVGVERTPTEHPLEYPLTIIQPRAGRLSFFTSGDENEHHVRKVTKGTRYAVTISFTCDEKFAIPDPQMK
eukprot:CFRG4657T1